MKPSSSNICLFFLSLFFLSIPPLQIQCNEDLIHQICNKTPFPTLCISSLTSDPSSSTMDTRGLACTMANIVLSNATNTLNFIQTLIKQASSDPQTERALAICAELYIPVVNYSLPQAIDALSKEQYAFAAYGISDAAKEADACEKNFSEPVVSSPLMERDKMVHCLSDVAVAIVKLLLQG